MHKGFSSPGVVRKVYEDVPSYSPKFFLLKSLQQVSSNLEPTYFDQKIRNMNEDKSVHGFMHNRVSPPRKTAKPGLFSI